MSPGTAAALARQSHSLPGGSALSLAGCPLPGLWERRARPRRGGEQQEEEEEEEEGEGAAGAACWRRSGGLVEGRVKLRLLLLLQEEMRR
jgi:hypothetical protein